MLKGIGYAICVIDIYVGMFYNTVIGWAVYYFVSSILSAGQVGFKLRNRMLLVMHTRNLKLDYKYQFNLNFLSSIVLT